MDGVESVLVLWHFLVLPCSWGGGWPRQIKDLRTASFHSNSCSIVIESVSCNLSLNCLVLPAFFWPFFWFHHQKKTLVELCLISLHTALSSSSHLHFTLSSFYPPRLLSKQVPSNAIGGLVHTHTSHPPTHRRYRHIPDTFIYLDRTSFLPWQPKLLRFASPDLVT